MAQLHVAGAKAAAAGDGAIQLMLASLVTGRLEAFPGDLPRARFRLGELPVDVTLVPANGLVDVNQAPPLLFAVLFHRIGGLEPGEARRVADNVLKWRSRPSGGAAAARGARRFTALEDLLRVEGVTRTLFDAVRDYLAVGEQSRGGTNWLAAPEKLLGLLQEADPGKASAVARQRGASREQLAAVPFSGGGLYRVDAVVRYGDDLWLRRRWVKMEPGGGSKLPWQVSRTEAPRVVAKAL